MILNFLVFFPFVTTGTFTGKTIFSSQKLLNFNWGITLGSPLLFLGFLNDSPFIVPSCIISKYIIYARLTTFSSFRLKFACGLLPL